MKVFLSNIREIKEFQILTLKNPIILEDESDKFLIHKAFQTLTKQWIAGLLQPIFQQLDTIWINRRYDIWKVWFNLAYWSNTAMLLLQSFTWKSNDKVFWLGFNWVLVRG